MLIDLWWNFNVWRGQDFKDCLIHLRSFQACNLHPTTCWRRLCYLAHEGQGCKGKVRGLHEQRTNPINYTHISRHLTTGTLTRTRSFLDGSSPTFPSTRVDVMPLPRSSLMLTRLAWPLTMKAVPRSSSSTRIRWATNGDHCSTSKSRELEMSPILTFTSLLSSSLQRLKESSRLFLQR